MYVTPSATPHPTSFLATRDSPPTDGFFQGYCFYESDYIFAQEGVREFEAETGKKVTHGLDGCYTLVRSDGESFIFQNDYSGYKLMYYYHDGESWAVSNSLAQIVSYMRESGLDITPNYAELAAIMTGGSAASQLFSFETTVKNVRLVPRATDLIITPGRAILSRWSAGSKIDYAEGLASHLDLWAGRFETLILNETLGVTIDVTGGVDSRTNFALLAFAKERLGGKGNYPRLNCGSTPSNTADLDVALELGTRFGLDINDGRRFPRYNLTPDESYQTYRDLNVGTSYTLYMPVESPHPSKLSIGGGGGEIHRKFYEGHLKSKDESKLLDSYGSRLKYPWLSLEHKRNARRALQYSVRPGLDPLRVHYREFRHRTHVGRVPRYGVSFTPLDSATADIAQSQAGQQRLDDGQFNYDILGSLSSELLEIPFDSTYKSPSSRVMSHLTKVEVSRDACPGRVWAPEVESRNVGRSAAKRHEALSHAAETALDNSFVIDFWGQEVLGQARDLLQELLAGRRIGNAVNGKPIAAILAADLATPSN